MSSSTFSAVLTTWAAVISQTLIALSKSSEHIRCSKDQAEAATVATQLHLINTYLKQLASRGPVDSATEKLCESLLESLVGIFRVKKRRQVKNEGPISYASNLFDRNLEPGSNGNRMKLDGPSAFFGGPRDSKCRKDLASHCQSLYSHLCDDGSGLPLRTENYVISEKEDIPSHEAFRALESHIKCKPSLHGGNASEDGEQSLSHPVRVSLTRHHTRTTPSDTHIPAFNVLVGTIGTDTYWEDFLMGMQPEESSDAIWPMDNQRFCSLLENPSSSRTTVLFHPERGISRPSGFVSRYLELSPGEGTPLYDILDTYDLKVKDKLVLSYNIARAYMTLYDSNLVQARWTGDNIVFMSERRYDNSDSPPWMPLQAYLRFPLDSDDGSILPEFTADDSFHHRYPRILNLGLLLLEVGCGKRRPPVRHGNPRSQVNRDFCIAQNMCDDLDKEDWGFVYKSSYVDALRFCIDTVNDTQPRTTTTPTSTAVDDTHNGILRRKTTIFREVVSRLGTLVHGFGTNQPKSYIHKATLPSKQHQGPSAQESGQPSAEFSTRSYARPAQWLEDLHEIGRNVGVQFRKQCKGRRLPSIAILDTGVNPDLLKEFGKEAAKRITFRDFVSIPGGARSDKVDGWGHGTLMAGLIMKCAPFATIVVARIAASSEELELRGGEIAEVRVDLYPMLSRILLIRITEQAIKWAAYDEKVDIISMSFKFKNKDSKVDNAIKEVYYKREENLIMFASAGNSSFEDEGFPASHKAVISIYATSCYGYFLPTNPTIDEHAAIALGTFGVLPEDFLSTLRNAHRNLHGSGTSIATAVAAATGAIILAYIDVLGKKDMGHTEGDRVKLKLARKMEGMHSLILCLGIKRNREVWMNLVGLWNGTSDEVRNRKILGGLDKQ